MGSRENNFPAAVVNELRRRAGEQCSVPSCTRTTIGPSRLSSGSHNSGIAAHIYSAMPGGPRGRGGLSPAQLKAYDNGLWCCERHGTFIDTTGGNGLDAATLRAYRHLAETRALLRNDDVRAPEAGWFDRVTIAEALPLAQPATIMFGKNSLLKGPNGSGKSIVADLIAGLGDAGHWRRRGSSDRRFRASIEYFDPEPMKVDVAIGGGEQRLDVTVNGVPGLPVPRVGVVHWSKQRFVYQGSPVACLAATLGVDDALVRAALLSWRSRGLLGVRGRASTAQGRRDQDGLEFWMPFSPTDDPASVPERYFPWGGLGGTERLRLGIEVAAALAQEHAKRHPTLLVIDSLGGAFDTKWTQYVLELVADRGNVYQTLVVSETELGLPSMDGWTVAETRLLRPVDPKVGHRYVVAQEQPLFAVS